MMTKGQARVFRAYRSLEDQGSEAVTLATLEIV